MKLKWERVNNGYDLRLTNPNVVNVRTLQELLQSVARPKSDFRKGFNKNITNIFNKWLKNYKTKSLREEAYTVLSNWFLGEGANRGKSTALFAELLWKTLFCATPKERLSNWKKDGSKVIPERFDKWWDEQKKCQEDY